MNVATFRATCKDCATQFDNPLLPDMYGEFIARGEKGTEFAYLTAFGNPGWDKIDQIFKTVFPEQDASLRSDCFQWVIGKCLDPINGQGLSIISGPICPNCRGTNVLYGDEIRTGGLELPNATFSSFLALDNVAQEQRIRELCDEWLGGFAKRA